MERTRSQLRVLAILTAIASIFTKCSEHGGEASVVTTHQKETAGYELEKYLKLDSCRYADLLMAVKPLEPGTKSRQEIEDFVFEANYRSHLQLALTNDTLTDKNAFVNAAALHKVKNYDGLHYISFSLENKSFRSELLRFNVESAVDYSERILYYAFHCKKDVYLIENNKDTLRGAFCHFERTFDVSPRLNLTFVFERKGHEPVKNLRFVYDDVVFNNGKLSFEFDSDAIAIMNAAGIEKILL